MVDLPRVNASKEANKVKTEEDSKRWQRAQKEAERQRFESRMFVNKRQATNVAKNQQQKTDSDADIYRFRQREEYSKFQQLIKDSGNKVKNQRSTAQNKSNKLFQEQRELKNNLQYNITKKNQNNRLTKQSEVNSKNKKQKLLAQQKSTKDTTKNIDKNNITDSLERAQQQRSRQNTQRNIIDNSKLKEAQGKKNKLQQSRETSFYQSNVDKKIKEQNQQTSRTDTAKMQDAARAQSVTKRQLTENIQKAQQEKNTLKDTALNSKKQHLQAASDKQNQDSINFSVKEKTIGDIKRQNQNQALNTTSKEKYDAKASKNQQDDIRLKKDNLDLDSFKIKQQQDDISNRQSIDKTTKSQLLQEQVAKDQTTKKATNYSRSISQQKQEKDDKISVEKLYQEQKILPLPQHINPNSTISQAMQDPASRVEIINHIAELIKIYRPFIVKDGSFNIVMPGSFWEGTKIVVDMLKKDLGVKISASEKTVNVLTQNKLALTQALQQADPELTITVDIKPIA